jgi:hypothetical protein
MILNQYLLYDKNTGEGGAIYTKDQNIVAVKNNRG